MEKKSGVIYSYQCRALTVETNISVKPQDPWRMLQGTSEGTLPHPGAQST